MYKIDSTEDRLQFLNSIRDTGFDWTYKGFLVLLFDQNHIEQCKWVCDHMGNLQVATGKQVAVLYFVASLPEGGKPETIKKQVDASHVNELSKSGNYSVGAGMERGCELFEVHDTPAIVAMNVWGESSSIGFNESNMKKLIPALRKSVEEIKKNETNFERYQGPMAHLDELNEEVESLNKLSGELNKHQRLLFDILNCVGDKMSEGDLLHLIKFCKEHVNDETKIDGIKKAHSSLKIVRHTLDYLRTKEEKRWPLKEPSLGHYQKKRDKIYEVLPEYRDDTLASAIQCLEREELSLRNYFKNFFDENSIRNHLISAFQDLHSQANVAKSDLDVCFVKFREFEQIFEKRLDTLPDFRALFMMNFSDAENCKSQDFDKKRKRNFIELSEKIVSIGSHLTEMATKILEGYAKVA